MIAGVYPGEAPFGSSYFVDSESVEATPTVRRVSLLSGVKSTTSDPDDDVRDVDKGWSNWV